MRIKDVLCPVLLQIRENFGDRLGAALRVLISSRLAQAISKQLLKVDIRSGMYLRVLPVCGGIKVIGEIVGYPAVSLEPKKLASLVLEAFASLSRFGRLPPKKTNSLMCFETFSSRSRSLRASRAAEAP